MQRLSERIYPVRQEKKKGRGGVDLMQHERRTETVMIVFCESETQMSHI